MTEQKRALRIRVSKDEGDKVNMTVPLGLAKVLRFGGIAKALKKHNDIDIDEILGEIDEIPDGKIVDVIDEKSGDHVEIYVETKVAGATTPEETTVG